MVGDPALRKIVRPDALRAIAGADLRLARIRTFVGGLVALKLVDAGFQHVHRQAPVLMLRFLRRHDDDAGRQMRDAHRRFRSC